MKKILSALVAVAFALPVLAQAPAAAPAAPAAKPAAAAPLRRSAAAAPAAPAAKPAAAAPAASPPRPRRSLQEGQEGPAGHHDDAPAVQVVLG